MLPLMSATARAFIMLVETASERVPTRCSRPFDPHKKTTYRAMSRAVRFAVQWPVVALRGVPMRGDDLVGGAAGNLGHVIELPRETAGTRRRRAQFDDQFADLGFRHQRADAVPALPALTGIEGQDLPAPRRQDGVDLRGGLGRTDDLDRMDRLRSTGWHCGKPSLMPTRAAVRNAR